MHISVARGEDSIYPTLVVGKLTQEEPKKLILTLIDFDFALWLNFVNGTLINTSMHC